MTLSTFLYDLALVLVVISFFLFILYVGKMGWAYRVLNVSRSDIIRCRSKSEEIKYFERGYKDRVGAIKWQALKFLREQDDPASKKVAKLLSAARGPYDICVLQTCLFIELEPKGGVIRIDNTPNDLLEEAEKIQYAIGILRQDIFNAK